MHAPHNAEGTLLSLRSPLGGLRVGDCDGADIGARESLPRPDLAGAAFQNCWLITVVRHWALDEQVVREERRASDWDGLKHRKESDEDLAQQKPEPSDQAAEVVADGGEDGVGGVAPTIPEIVTAHAMLDFEMADHGFDGGPAAQLAFDLGCHAPFLAGDEDPELVRRRVVAAVSLVGEDTLRPDAWR